MSASKRAAAVLEKFSTGIEGFDEITSGGLPRGRTTLLMGGPGCGKTVFALQALVHGAAHQDAPGIFVAFEEDAERVQANAESFGWTVGGRQKKGLYFLNAHLSPDTVQAGAFDLSALLAVLEAKAREMGAKTIVFDALDVLLTLLDDTAAERRELYRIQEWLTRTGLSAILTTKIEQNESAFGQRYGFLPFMVDCVVFLRQRILDRVAVREMRVLKYRGSTHVLNEVPFVIGPAGVEVGASNGVHPEPQPFAERLSTGVGQLDEMLNGGVFRGTNMLLTGSTGTGKTMLAGIFLDAACRRGERSLFVSFDENVRDIVRDLASIGVDLAPHLASGLLHMEALRTEAAASEDHLIRIKRLVHAHTPKCLAIDPLSALVRVGGESAARHAAERLIYLCRNARITVLFTSLLEGDDAAFEETTPLHILTLADAWIQISYLLRGGERNRALTIIKSRGSKHSNQMRELVMTDNGITLADYYTAGGEVLMGTLRAEKENAVNIEHERLLHEIEHKRREVELVQLDSRQRVEAARLDVQARDEELVRLTLASAAHQPEGADGQGVAMPKRNEKRLQKQMGSAKPARTKARARSTTRSRKP